MVAVPIEQGASAFIQPNEIIEDFLISEVDDSDRMRPSDPLVVQAIAASMAKDGQLSPIDVCRLPGKKGVKLVFGGHRLDAAKLNGWTTIKGVQRSANALERKSREIAENFFRASLSPLDLARFVSELIANEKARLGIADDEDGRSLNADVRSKKAKEKQLDDDLCSVHKSLGLQEAVAARLGLHRATVSRHLTLNGLAPSIVARVRALPIADNATALRKLAAMAPDDQVKAVTLIESGRCRGVNDAAAVIAQKPVPDASRKRLRAFLDAFGRMNRSEQMSALRLLSLPRGVKLDWDGAQVATGLTVTRVDTPPTAASPRSPLPASSGVGEGRDPSGGPDGVVDLEEMLARGAAE